MNFFILYSAFCEMSTVFRQKGERSITEFYVFFQKKLAPNCEKLYNI